MKSLSFLCFTLALFLSAAELYPSPTFLGQNFTAPGGGAPTPDLLHLKLNVGTGTTGLTAEVGSAFSHNADWVAEGSGYALSFVRANTDTLYTDSAINYGGADKITLTFPWYPRNITDTQMLVESSANSNGTAGAYWVLIDGGNINVSIRDNAGATSSWTCASPAANTAWAHIAVVYNFTAGTIKLYINGVLQSLTPDATGFSTPTTAANHILFFAARGFASFPADCKLDDIKLFSGELSAGQIAALAALHE